MPIINPKCYLYRTKFITKKHITMLLALMFCMSVFSSTAIASTGEDNPPITTLIVNAAWLDSESEGLPSTIRIDVTDPETGERSAIAVPLRDYMREGDNSEFIAIQAVDLNGKQSGVIEIKNPFFNPNLPQGNADNANNSASNKGSDNDTGKGGGNYQNQDPSTSAVDTPNTNTHLRPFTPDGTGTVVDNVDDNDGKEFFTIFSEDGNEFFLIVDRHRNADNVYFLNSVTEEDLMSLARKAGREIESNNYNGISAIPTPPQTPELGTDEPNGNEIPAPELPPENDRPSAFNRIASNLLFFIGIIVVTGGIAYYLKVMRPNKNGYSDSYDGEPDDYDYDNAVDEDAGHMEDGDED